MSSTISAVKQLRNLLTRKEKRQWLEIGIFAIVTSILELATAFTIVAFARSLTQPTKALDYLHQVGIHQNLSSTKVLFYMSFLVGFIYLIKNSVTALEALHQNYVIQKMQHRCENSLLDRYLTMDYGSYLTKNSAYGLSSIEDVEDIFSRGVVCLASVFSEAFVFICLIGMIVYINPYLALTIFAIGTLLYLVVTKAAFPFFYRWGKIQQEKDSICQKSLLQFFGSFKEIILSGKQGIFAQQYSELSAEKVKIQAVIRTVNTLPRMILEIIFIGLFVVAVAYSCLQQQTSQVMLGTLAGYLYVGFRIMPGLNRIITQLNVFKTSIPHIDRVYKEFSTTSEKEAYATIPEFSFQSHIQINHLFFNYKQSEKQVLSNINLTIRKGECIGIVGETGSGKSTFVDIILGLLKPISGAVLIDDKFNVQCKEWHHLIGYVPQTNYLIDDTIAANIAYGEKPGLVDIKKLNQAIDDAQLRPFVDDLPLGSQTIVGERGVLLSGGERQRIAIARALYRQPTILIFDEATSALDTPTEAKLMETLNLVRKNRTVIMIAHRLTTLKECDRIVVLKKGKITNITNYADLTNSMTQTEEHA